MKTFSVLVFCAIVSLFSCYCFAANQNSDLKVGFCGDENATVSYGIMEDYIIGCEGIARAKTFFANYGYSVDVPVRIYFRQRVLAAVNHPEIDQKQIYGYFDSKTMHVYMSSLSSSFVDDPEKVYLGIEHHKGTNDGTRQSKLILEELHRSVITHEVAHLYAQHNFNLQAVETPQKQKKMGHGVHEYIASVVQLSTMEPNLRQRILESYVPEIIFDDEQQINWLLFACDPEKFCIMSFRHFHSMSTKQQRVLLDRMFSNNLNPDLVLKF